MSWEIRQGDCLEVLADLEPDSIDAIVTDPPYGLGFMGKAWDALPPGREWAELCLRVLKPGGHVVAFGGSRTYHRLAVAVEDAGFEIRDQIMWLYGSGFPKSLDIAKSIDKSAGYWRGKAGEVSSDNGAMSGPNYVRTDKGEPVTAAAAAWQGWGTALKPAHEPIVLARKPLEGTVARNVLEHGTGGLNIDGCRIATTDDLSGGTYGGVFGASRAQCAKCDGDGYYDEPGEYGDSGHGPRIGSVTCTACGGDGTVLPKAIGSGDKGRWPANTVLDEDAAAILDADPTATEDVGYGDSGGASRFFYTAKASRAERNAGLENTEGKRIGAKGNGMARTCSSCGASVLDGCDCPDRTFENPVRKNHHPTVKPIDVMRWLVRLVTPAGGTVLDPFTGSGTTGIAAALEGFNFVGVEREPEYRQIAVARMEWWGQHRGDTADILFRAGLADKAKKRHDEAGQLGLLEDAA